MFKYKYTAHLTTGRQFSVWGNPSPKVINTLHGGLDRARVAYFEDAATAIQAWAQNGRGFLITGYASSDTRPEDIHTLFVNYPAMVTIEIDLVEFNTPSLVQATAPVPHTGEDGRYRTENGEPR